MRSRLSRGWPLLAWLAFAGCESGAPDERQVPEVQAREGLIQLSVPLNRIAPSVILEPDLELAGLTHPQDVATFADGRIAVLDRLDRQVLVFDAEGQQVAVVGRPGEGPGEFVEPYALAVGGEFIAVWDKRPTLSVLRSGGEVVGSASLTEGDTRATWQRLPLSRWDAPFQASREDVTRRLDAMSGSRFGLLLQVQDERFGDILEAGEWTRLDYHLLVFDSTAAVIDTLTVLPGQELTLHRPAGARRFALPAESPFAHRPAWTSGRNWYATGHGSDTAVVVRYEAAESMLVTWPRDVRPLDLEDYNSLIDFEMEAIRRTEHDDIVARLEQVDREGWIENELRQWKERPQLSFIFGSGPCIAMAGYRPNEGPLGNSGAIMILNLENGEGRVVALSSDFPGFVRAFEGRRLFRIGVTEAGERVVEGFSVQGVGCADG